MAMSELDSFFVKFKNLWSAGKNASLLIKSLAGKAVVKLELDLGDAPIQPTLHAFHQQRFRNGPARQRRRLRRAAEREAVKTSEVVENTSEEEAAAEDNEKVTAEGAMNKYVEHVQNSLHESKDTRDDKVAGEANNSSENSFDEYYRLSDKTEDPITKTFHYIIYEVCPTTSIMSPFN